MKRNNGITLAVLFAALALTPPRVSAGAIGGPQPMPPLDLKSGVLAVPRDLKPGDSYRIVFVTSKGRDAISSNIADYDSFVNAVANGNGSMLKTLNASWLAIASTSTVDAFTHIGGTFSTGIYLLDGTLVAAGSGPLWGSPFPALAHSISMTELGAPDKFTTVWTGTKNDGTKRETTFLGSTAASTGGPVATGLAWVNTPGSLPTYTTHNLYGISSVLTVPSSRLDPMVDNSVPEPATAGMAFSAFLGAFLLSARQRYRLFTKFKIISLNSSTT